MPRPKRQPTKSVVPSLPTPKSLSEEAEVTALDMAVLNEFIHDPGRSDSLRLAALKVKVGREAAMLKERIAEKSGGMSITVQSLDGEDEPDEGE